MSGMEISNLIQTGELAKDEVADKLVKEAEAHAEQIETIKEQKSKRKKALIKFGSMAVLAAVVVVFATIAWFSMNRTVETSGMSVTTATMPFEIATTGTLVRNQEQFDTVRPNYTEGYASGIYKTSQNTDSLMLRFTPNEDDPETEEDESEVPDIGPNSNGELNLYIIPKRDGDIDAYIDLNIVSFKAVKVDDEDVLIEITDVLTSDPNLTSTQIDDCKEAAEYLKGHIMFFQGISPSPATYSYVTPVIDGKIHFHQDDAVTGTAYKVPIYWTWPNTLGQIALKTNALDLRDGTPVVQETTSTSMGTSSNPTDKALVLKYLKDNKDIVFKDLDTSVFSTEELIASMTDEQQTAYSTLETDEEKAEYLEANANIDNCVDNAIDKADTRKNFDFLSDGYNTADFSIGTNLDYFLIEVNVSSGE